jgi:hypothetical protein
MGLTSAAFPTMGRRINPMNAYDPIVSIFASREQSKSELTLGTLKSLANSSIAPTTTNIFIRTHLLIP